MAKFNFNDTKYSIDEASLSSATAALKSHLSTVMNGSGTTITLDGVTYNIDSTKLSTVTAEFVNHLGKIAGNGKKVVVNGVEYSISLDKVSDAVTELEAHWGGMNTPDVVAVLDEAILDYAVLG